MPSALLQLEDMRYAAQTYNRAFNVGGSFMVQWGRMSQIKLQTFIADVTALKQGSRFYHPSITIDDRFGRDTSVKGLINYLRGHFVAAQPMTLSDVVAHCAAPTDNRIVKYMPAIERLVACWGRAAPYPAILASTDARNPVPMENHA